jgi:hypothetical protein
MAAAMSRRLLCTRRQVPLDRSDDYLLAWLAVRRAAEAAGARAWIFRGVGHEDHFLEFVEWTDDSGPLEDETLGAAMAQLASFAAAASSEEWEEAT